MGSPNLAIRRMTETDLAVALDWAAAEGWNPGLNDAARFHLADPEGFFIGEANGEPIGAISAVRYDERFGFLGLYLVRPEFRGRGFGLKLWQAAMRHLAERNVGLDGVVAQQENYKKSGFKLAFRNIRYRGEGGGADAGGATDLASLPFDEVLRYDSAMFPAPRANFLRAWIGQPQATALGVVDQGKLRGYGVLRPCRSGCKIGPLFADDARIAERLFLALRARAAGQPIVLDVPEVNPAAVALAERYRMGPVFETARMYTKNSPQAPMERCFGVTTFELG